MAAGWSMGTGRCPLVYMQNSGLANALNPLMSLTHRSVYPVPMVLLIGRRGWPGDEPQHQAIGRGTEQLLDAADIPYVAVTAESELVPALAHAHRTARGTTSTVAVLVSPDTSPTAGSCSRGGQTSDAWTSREAVRLVLDSAPPGSIVVSSTGFNTRYVNEYREEHPGRYRDYVYCVGAMGHACSIAQGLAIARPFAPVICIDGDGSALMHLGAVVTAGWLARPNYVHVVVNNGSHESVGGGDTLGSVVPISDLVAGRWWTNQRFRGPTTPSVVRSLTNLLGADGPILIEMFTRPSAARPPARPKLPFVHLEPSTDGM